MNQFPWVGYRRTGLLGDPKITNASFREDRQLQCGTGFRQVRARWLPAAAAVGLALGAMAAAGVTVGAGPAAAATQEPCDIYAAAGTPCVAAHSTTRALYAAYDGPLYQILRQSDGKTLDIGIVQPSAQTVPDAGG